MDDRLIKGYGRPLHMKKFKDDGTQNDNGTAEHDKLVKEDTEGKCIRVEFKRNQISKELTDRKNLSTT